MVFLTKMDGYRIFKKKCNINQNVTIMGMTIKGVYNMGLVGYCWIYGTNFTYICVNMFMCNFHIVIFNYVVCM